MNGKSRHTTPVLILHDTRKHANTQQSTQQPNRQCCSGGHYWDYYHGALSFKPNHCNSSEDHASQSLIFKWVVEIDFNHLPLMPHICDSELGQHWLSLWLVTYLMPSHYLNQCWDTVNWTPRNKLQWNFNKNTKLFIHENAHKKYCLQNGGHFCPGQIWNLSQH